MLALFRPASLRVAVVASLLTVPAAFGVQAANITPPVAPMPSAPIETPAKQAIIIDYDTGTVLFEKNADQLMVPSSMSKLMTIYMVFKKLKEGSWNLNDTLTVSEAAWKKHYKSDESMMFLPIGATPTVSDLIRGVVIQSGNDACSVLAEAYSGSEEAFAEDETRVARNELGMTHSTFRNAAGMPEPDHLTTARDLATLARHIIADFPDYYPMFSEKSFTYNNIKQDNRNPLLWTTQGADGLKTGHTEAGGYGLTASVKRGDRRLIMVINGLEKQKERWDESQRLIEVGFREFDNYTLFKGGETATTADVWLGTQATVPLLVGDKMTVTLPRRVRNEMKATAVFDNPVAAPVVKGQKIGKLVITAPGAQTVELPLTAGADVPKLGLGGRMGAAFHYLLWGAKSQ